MAAATIYKVCSEDAFAKSLEAGRFTGMPVDLADGYLHFSTAEQLRETLRRYFAGQRALVLFGVATAAVGDKLRWEASRGGDLFPHLYGELAMGDIGRQAVISVADDGSADLPDWVT